jgi:isopenicillin N synthase-like dioxygenase
MSWVPVVDLTSPTAVDQIEAACRGVGFLTIAGHGVDPAVIHNAWETARRFFDLPLKDRTEVAMPFAGYPYGFSALASETLAGSLGNGGPPDQKSSFGIGPVVAPTRSFADPDEASAWSPNLWPAALPELRPAWEAYYVAMANLSARLLSLMAQALRIAPNYFDSLIDRHTSAMRALDYPPAKPTHAAVLGAGAHTDYGTLTILLADPNVGGLQVQATNGDWHNVDPIEGTFVVNLGDAMARWTNDRWQSTMHRVLAPSERRQSIAFFHNANWDARIECIPSCLADGEQPKYSPISAGPHLMQKFRSTVGGNTRTPSNADEAISLLTHHGEK